MPRSCVQFEPWLLRPPFCLSKQLQDVGSVNWLAVSEQTPSIWVHLLPSIIKDVSSLQNACVYTVICYLWLKLVYVTHQKVLDLRKYPISTLVFLFYDKEFQIFSGGHITDRSDMVCPVVHVKGPLVKTALQCTGAWQHGRNLDYLSTRMSVKLIFRAAHV